MNDMYQILPYYFLKFFSKIKRFQSMFTLISMIFFTSIVFTAKVSATEPSAIEKSTTETQLTPTDAQKLWDRSCFTCHGDSGDIARNFLTVVDGKLQGPMHQETFRIFLTNHYLSEIKADAIYSMLLTQATTKTRFEQECGNCHQKETDFVRKKLALHNGVLYSRKLKTPVYGFLETHRDLKKNEVKFFMKKLTLTGYEIYIPEKLPSP